MSRFTARVRRHLTTVPVRYGAATLFAGIAYCVVATLEVPLLSLTLLVYLIAVVASFWLVRTGPGIACVLLSAACLYSYVSIGRPLFTLDPTDALLKRADDLAWNNQWLEASPLYAEVEAAYRGHDPSRALYAHVSQYIVRAEREPIEPLLVELHNDSALPESRDRKTRLRILVIQGMLETNYDALQARETWTEVARLRTPPSVGDDRW